MTFAAFITPYLEQANANSNTCPYPPRYHLRKDSGLHQLLKEYSY